MVLPSLGPSQAVATDAIGTSGKGEYSPINGDKEALCSVKYNGTVFDPATHVSA